MLDTFATADQSEQRTEGDIPAAHPFVEFALKAATRRIRNYCGWHIAKVETTTVRRRPVPHPELWLPTTMLTAVTELYHGVAEADVTRLEWYEYGLVIVSSQSQPLSITFSHGYEEIPADVADLALIMAARSLGAPIGQQREQSLTASILYSATAQSVAGGTVLMEHEKAGLAEYKIGYQA